MNHEVTEINRDGIRRVVEELARWLGRLAGVLIPRPKEPRVLSKRQIAMSQFGFIFEAPTPTAPDVAKYRAQINVNGSDLPPTDYDIAANTDELVADVGASVTVSYAEIDAAGNVSAFGPMLSFTVADDVAPDAPAAPVIASHREVTP